MTLRVFLLILFAETLAITGQVFFKKGVNNLPDFSLKEIKSSLRFFKGVLKAGWVWWGILLMTGWLLLWILVLNQTELSIAFPLESIQYVLIIFSSYFFLKEPLNWNRVLGTILIVLGIILVPLR